MNPEAQSEANDSLQSRLTIVDYVDAVTTDWSSTRLRSISDGVIAGLMANLLTAGVVAFVVANSDGLMTAAQITLAVLVALTGLMVVFAALAILLVLQSQFHEGLRLVAERR